jgi:1-acyl-sn-glycerol-3-phosphate acyltransferase
VTAAAGTTMVGPVGTRGRALGVDGASADCEARDGWGFAQDVNAWTSFAYVAVAVVLVVAVVRSRLDGIARGCLLVFAALVAAEGVGSVLFHGGSTRGGHFVHDAALVGMLGYVAGWQVSRAVGGLGVAHDPAADARRAVVGAAVAVAVSSVSWWSVPEATNALAAVLVGIVVVAELVARRRGRGGIWNAPLVVLVAVAGVFWVLGTGDSPTCAPGSALQPHGVWHAVSAVVALAWFDRALEVSAPDVAPRLFRRLIDRSVGLLAVVLVRVFHRTVEVEGRRHVPDDVPVLFVASHGNGFVDPVVVAASLGRLPRFLAKAALWKVVVARPFLGFAGALPVYRAKDGDSTADNASVFAECHRELGRGAMVAIFPEGTTGDRAGLDRVRSGAARIALGALDDAPELVIVPVGMAFESRIETRSRAYVEFGSPIAVAPFRTSQPDPRAGPDAGADADVRSNAEPAPDDVHALTGVIARDLTAVSPQFASVDERDTFRAAARVSERVAAGGLEPRFSSVERTARRIAAAPADVRREVMDSFERFALQLALADLAEDDLRARTTRLARVVVSVVVLALFGSLFVTASLVFLPAAVLTVGATSAIRSTATKGTVRLLVGLVTGLVTMVVAGIVLADGVAAFVTGIGVGVLAAVALFVWTPLLRSARVLIGRVRVRNRGSAIERVMAERDRLVATVRLAVDAEAGVAAGSAPAASSEAGPP